MIVLLVLAELALHLFHPIIDIKSSPSKLAARIENGTVVVDSFTLYNSAYIGLKDPVVVCDLKGQSGTTISSPQKTIYEAISPESRHAFEPVVLGNVDEQASEIGCRVKSVSVRWPWQ